MIITVKRLESEDIPWIAEIFTNRWGGDFIITRGKKHYPNELEGFIALSEEKRVGILTYKIYDNEMEIISLDSLEEHQGVGTYLLSEVKKIAQQLGMKKIRLITTNDNVKAIRFYQKRGFKIKAIHRNALEISRKIKPSIPLIGMNNIPLTDEVELEFRS